MKSRKSHFKFNKQERSGIFFLLLLLILVQIGYFVFKEYNPKGSGMMVPDSELQQKIDALRQNAIAKDTVKIYPFNPNFITDYKGYTLGLSVEEIDRLHTFRADSKFANSSEEFQKVTQISDSLLNVISPYFKFPEWTQRKLKTHPRYNINKVSSETKQKLQVRDLNAATEEELKDVNGIGDKLAERIIKFRDRLGGFLMDEQLYDVYWLPPEVAQRTLVKFRVMEVPKIEKIDLNTATVEELSRLVYIQKRVAYAIVDYRNRNGPILSFDKLLEIEGFPAERIDRIPLYLFLKK